MIKDKLFLEEFDEEPIEEAKKPKRRRKPKKAPYSSMTITTGDIGLNIDRFNTAMGTAEAGDSGADIGASEGGGLGEGLITEAKRYVRRYYIRPQNIFCSNKAEIIKALIELDDKNCSVYTLNNLGDDKDVSKLMNSDIIYYYDDGILYDKNRVKVMDYDLSIKKEEERKHFANVDNASDKEFKAEYEDRMTDATELEEGILDPLRNKLIIKVALQKAIQYALDKYIDEIHYNEIQRAWMRPDSMRSFIESSITEYLSEHYPELDGVINFQDGCQFLVPIFNKLLSVPDEDEAEAQFSVNSVKLKLIKKSVHRSESSGLEEAFNLDFDSYNVFGERLTEAKHEDCCICGESIEGYGNNPEPYMSADKGKCCDSCNLHFVIPMRLEQSKED